jgi:hypothetical protein
VWTGLSRYRARAAVTTDDVLRPLRVTSSSSAASSDPGILVNSCDTAISYLKITAALGPAMKLARSTTLSPEKIFSVVMIDS